MDDILLSDDDFRKFLSTLEKKLQVVRDNVTGVGKGFKTGFYLHGPGARASRTRSCASSNIFRSAINCTTGA